MKVVVLLPFFYVSYICIVQCNTEGFKTKENPEKIVNFDYAGDFPEKFKYFLISKEVM